MTNFIDWNTLDFKKTSGKEKVRCPICDAANKRAGDKPIAINHNDGYGKCFRCESLTFKEKKENDYSKKQYTDLTKVEIKKVIDEDIMRGVKLRKISENTLNALYVTFEKYYQPAYQKEVNNLVFNYYEGSKLVNKKFRAKGKKFTQTSGGKPIFYNINSVIGQDEVYIVEGEFDVLAMYEHGIKNVISVPNGANDNDDYWLNSESYLKEIKKFIIAVDNDEKGNDLKEKIGQRLGRYRCEYIEWQNKDANGDLIAGCISETLQNRKRFPVNGTFTVNDLMGDILDLYDNGLPETFSPKDSCFKGLKEMYSVMRGQLSVGTGIPSHGKSNYTDWYVLNLIKDYNLKGSWFSPEHSPMSLYQSNLIEKVIGRNFWKDKDGHKRITKTEIKKYEEWANERIYLTDVSDGEFPTWDWLFDKFKEQMFNFGIDIFVIDAFNKVLLPKGQNKIDAINEVLTKLTSFAKTNNVFIFLIAHPTKMQKNEKTGLLNTPTLYDVSGSADFRNQTHNGYTIYRYFGDDVTGKDGYTEFTNMKTKFNFQGQIGGVVNFKYCELNGRFYSNGIEPTYSFLEEPKEVQEVIDYTIPRTTLLDAFGEAYDDESQVPF
jgi:twinkle protein